ncbi:hypothetical protein E2C01_023618 [Portunus trituberculatus]|uniref:Uncharacterized protein n=1 Tax=Portunus trituberculatus TaxID=210409 RepID=A0A5B7EAH0_PORTR|nr:hypothetical protein [Portunus trituberculatus]
MPSKHSSFLEGQYLLGNAESQAAKHLDSGGVRGLAAGKRESVAGARTRRIPAGGSLLETKLSRSRQQNFQELRNCPALQLERTNSVLLN